MKNVKICGVIFLMPGRGQSSCIGEPINYKWLSLYFQQLHNNKFFLIKALTKVNFLQTTNTYL